MKYAALITEFRAPWRCLEKRNRNITAHRSFHGCSPNESNTITLICKERTWKKLLDDSCWWYMQPKEVWRYWKTSKPWTQPTHSINFDANEVEPQSLSPWDPHLGQAITQIIYLHCFLSSPLHWGQKLFLLISHKWHCPAQLIIIQAPCLSWLIGMRVHWSICLRISPEAATPPSTLGSLSRAVRDRYRCADFENRCSSRAKTIRSR